MPGGALPLLHMLFTNVHYLTCMLLVRDVQSVLGIPKDLNTFFFLLIR